MPRDSRFVYPENARNPAYRAQLEEILAAGVCPFCPEHMTRWKSEPVIIEGKHWQVTRVDPHVTYKNSIGHFMFIARGEHPVTSDEMADGAEVELFMLKDRIKRDYELPHATFVMREGGPATGQTVAHLHAQLVSAGPDDPVLTRI